MRNHLSVVGALLLSLAPRLTAAQSPGPIVILGALETETQPVAAALSEREPVAVLGIPCVSGRLAGRSVILAATGVGKVNAAMTTALLVERFAPEAVIFTGIAGALDPELHPGDVVVGEKLVQHDLLNHTETGAVLRNVRNPRDGAANPIELWPSSRLLALARRAAAVVALEPVQDESGPRVPRVHFGTIATGDSFIGSPKKKDELHAQLGADAVEMEGAAVGQVCHQLGVPFLVIRGLSDRAGSGARAEAQRNLGVTARNSAQVAVAVARSLAMEPAQTEP
jgi:adenosylhomocysteine nucleosidase